jgi:spore germination protein YaaH
VIFKKIFKLVFIFLVLLTVGGVVYGWVGGGTNILSPLSTKKEIKAEKERMEVVGFLPSWMVGKTIDYSNEVDKLIFLGVEVDREGNLIWDGQSKKINSDEYLKQKELIWENKGKNILGIKLFKDELIDELMSSEEAQNNLINQLKELRNDNKFDGINVDFEYQGNPTGVLSEEMIGFLNKFKKSGLGEISLDVFVNTINKGSVEQITKLMDAVDELIIMAYDFHRPGVDFAGAVAPIQAETGERSIKEVVDRILSLEIDRKKIILAYPLYGYEWKTYKEDFGSPIIRGWYQMASWKRVKEILETADAKALAVKWDEVSMTPWMVFKEDGKIHQIYFENERSLKIKLDLAEQNQFGGVGFWALGYEGGDRSVWNLVNR